MIIIALVLLGLCLGSFVNAFVWRTHEQQAKSPKSKAKSRKLFARQNPYSIITGRSMCTRCHHQLAVRDLIPVLSWLSLGGKCRYCHKKIADSPLTELTAALLFVVSYIFWPYGLDGAGLFMFIMWLPILVLLIGLFIYDLRYMLLPDKLTFALFALTAVRLIGLIIYSGGAISLFWNALLGVLCLAGFFYALFQLSSGRWIGGGDVKLGVGLGLLAGSAPKALLILFLASAVGTLISMTLLAGNKLSKKAQIPFGPFLISAAIIVQLFGPALIEWYQRQFLFM